MVVSLKIGLGKHSYSSTETHLHWAHHHDWSTSLLNGRSMISSVLKQDSSRIHSLLTTLSILSIAQGVQKLASFSDRAGAHPSNGRDIGVQIQGDFLKTAAGRNLVHYQVGVFDGQGINVRDVDQQKNIIGGVWVMPVEGMRLGWFGQGNMDRRSWRPTLRCT